MYTTPSDRDFFLCNIQLSLQADVTADNTSAFIQFTTDGTSRFFLLPKLTTTVFQDSVVMNLSTPLKIDRNTNIILTSTYTVGTATTHGFISGYLNSPSQPQQKIQT